MTKIERIERKLSNCEMDIARKSWAQKLTRYEEDNVLKETDGGHIFD